MPNKCLHLVPVYFGPNMPNTFSVPRLFPVVDGWHQIVQGSQRWLLVLAYALLGVGGAIGDAGEDIVGNVLIGTALRWMTWFSEGHGGFGTRASAIRAVLSSRRMGVHRRRRWTEDVRDAIGECSTSLGYREMSDLKTSFSNSILYRFGLTREPP